MATVTADPATTVVAGAAVGDQSTPTVTFAPGAGSTCGPGTPLGSSLPAFLQLLPDEPDAAGPATFDAEGHLVTRRESGRFAVEALWPAPDRQLYAPDGAADEVSPRPYGSITVLGSHETGSDVTVSGATGGTTVLRVLISDPVAVDEACRYVQFTVTEDDAVIARFAYDLAAIGDESPLVDRGPLVVETRQVAEAPAETVPCGGADDNGSPPNLDETAVGPAAPTPAEALDAYLATPEAATFYRSGYVEMITPDGTYVYGARFEGDPSQWVTLVTVERVQGGWAATRVSASGC